MFYSLITAVLFASSAVCAGRIARHFGSLKANFLRLSLAWAVLGLLTWAFYPHTIGGKPSQWFLVSGLVGFGLGDVALYLALPRLGSRLTLLMTVCLAPLFGAFGDYVGGGPLITWPEVAASAAILAGVALALRPDEGAPLLPGQFGLGMVCGIFSGMGQGWGGSLSQVANAAARAEGLPEIPGISQAFQRISAGLLVGAAAFAWQSWRQREAGPAPAQNSPIALWLIGAALAGPILGVSCFQTAMLHTSTVVVLVIVATAPILVIPLTWVTDGDRPRPRALAGAMVAVAGVAGLLALRGS